MAAPVRTPVVHRDHLPGQGREVAEKPFELLDLSDEEVLTVGVYSGG